MALGRFATLAGLARLTGFSFAHSWTTICSGHLFQLLHRSQSQSTSQRFQLLFRQLGRRTATAARSAAGGASCLTAPTTTRRAFLKRSISPACGCPSACLGPVGTAALAHSGFASFLESSIGPARRFLGPARGRFFLGTGPATAATAISCHLLGIWLTLCLLDQIIFYFFSLSTTIKMKAPPIMRINK